MTDDFRFEVDPRLVVEIPTDTQQRVAMVGETLGYYTQQIDDLVKSVAEAKKREITLAVALLEARLMVEMFHARLTPETYASTIACIAHQAGEARQAVDDQRAEISNQFRAFVGAAMDKGTQNFLNKE